MRLFRVPKLLFDATDYTKIIDWDNTPVSEPVTTADMNQQDLEKSQRFNGIFGMCDNRTQSVERGVKLVTEASRSVLGFERRDGYIKAGIKSRELMPTFNTKHGMALSMK